MSTQAPPLPWQPNRPSLRLRYGVALAIALHITFVWWWREWRVPEAPAPAPGLRLRLAPGEPVNPAPIAPRVEQSPPPSVESVDSKPAPAAPTMERPPAVEQETLTDAAPRAHEILSRLQRYRLTSAPLPAEPPPAPRSLARAREVTPVDWLDPALPDLPFADTPLDIPFYAFGPKGDLQRFRDAVTREFGFRTRYGTEVKCVWMVVVVGCAWD